MRLSGRAVGKTRRFTGARQKSFTPVPRCVTFVGMPPRDDISREWARIGDRVAAALPRAQVRRLLGILRKLPGADPLDAADAVALFEAALTERPPRTLCCALERLADCVREVQGHLAARRRLRGCGGGSGTRS